MNCLTYLLDLWNRGHRFKILYNGDHCIGVSSKKIFDFGNFFKEDLLNNKQGAYTPIETWHTSETIFKIFSLTNKEDEIIKDYYEFSARIYSNEK